MRLRTAGALTLLCALAAMGTSGAETSSGQPYLGTWVGSWEGGTGSGGLELTLERSQDTLAGKVSVTGEPTYEVALASLSFEGAKLTARYEYPPDPTIEVLLTATFDASAAAGTWVARAKESGADVASGTWKVTRKP
jgi:hypothetical protein